MAATKFFKNPFATVGDKTAVPDGVQAGGLVSYAEGYSLRYSLNKDTDPSGLDFPRNQHNQLLFDITTALKQYQTIGVPNFVSASDNGGTPFPYQKFAYALYDDGVNGPRPYQSLVDNNTALPTDPTKWSLDVGEDQTLIINNVVFDTGVVDGDAVYFDTSVNKYDKAVDNGTETRNLLGIADVTNKRVFIGGVVTLSGLTTGAVYYLSTTTPGTLETPAGLSGVRAGVAISTTKLIFWPIVFPLNYTARVTRSTPQNILPNVGTKVQWDQVIIDRQSIFDAGNFYFVIKEDGDYFLGALVNLSSITTGTLISLQIVKNGTDVILRGQSDTSTGRVVNISAPTITTVAALEEGDTVEVQMSHNDTTTDPSNIDILMDFWIKKISTQS